MNTLAVQHRRRLRQVDVVHYGNELVVEGVCGPRVDRRLGLVGQGRGQVVGQVGQQAAGRVGAGRRRWVRAGVGRYVNHFHRGRNGLGGGFRALRQMGQLRQQRVGFFRERCLGLERGVERLVERRVRVVISQLKVERRLGVLALVVAPAAQKENGAADENNEAGDSHGQAHGQALVVAHDYENRRGSEQKRLKDDR